MGRLRPAVERLTISSLKLSSLEEFAFKIGSIQGGTPPLLLAGLECSVSDNATEPVRVLVVKQNPALPGERLEKLERIE
ncbi:hypothetical protein RRG08_020685 [Elysia crispata]|uniref:Uncharacterized protein n=1 Tax=Elysia crispata TaxID=231223 RepID=A0AAE0Z5E4_9GAST|nr:hypothetical protein RRG08_020685 [Elysia crispata]